MEVSKENILKQGKVCTTNEKVSFVQLFQEFNNVFSWEYENLKGFNLQLAQHTIELE